MKEQEIEELISELQKACDLFDRIQEKKAVLEAEQIIKEFSDVRPRNYREG